MNGRKEEKTNKNTEMIRVYGVRTTHLFMDTANVMSLASNVFRKENTYTWCTATLARSLIEKLEQWMS